MSWVLVAGTTWPLLAVPAAVLIGRLLRGRDHRAAIEAHVTVPDFVPAQLATSVPASPSSPRGDRSTN